MLAEYLPILIFILSVATGCHPDSPSVTWRNSWRPGAVVRTAKKDHPTSAVSKPSRTRASKFDVRYYLVAILFIIFDLEIAFFIPWALVLDKLGVFGLVAMVMFRGELVIGFFFVWKKGALEWEYQPSSTGEGRRHPAPCDDANPLLDRGMVTTARIALINWARTNSRCGR